MGVSSASRNEAFSNVRFTLCGRALPSTALPEAERSRFLEALERAFKLARHRAHLRALHAQMEREVPDVEGYFGGARIAPSLDEIFREMDRGAEELFGPHAARRSDWSSGPGA